MGSEQQAQTATHFLKARQGQWQCEQDGIRATSTDSNSPPESKRRDNANVRRRGSEQQAQTATHQLKARQEQWQCEQDGIRAKSTDSNSHTESKAGTMAM